MLNDLVNEQIRVRQPSQRGNYVKTQSQKTTLGDGDVLPEGETLVYLLVSLNIRKYTESLRKCTFSNVLPMPFTLPHLSGWSFLFIICCFNCPFAMIKSMKLARAHSPAWRTLDGPVGRKSSRWTWCESVRIQEVNERCGGPTAVKVNVEVFNVWMLKPDQWCCLYLKQPVQLGSPCWILSHQQHPELWGPGGGGLLDLLWAACFHSWRPETLHFTSF